MSTHDLGEARRLARSKVLALGSWPEADIESGPALSFFSAPRTLEARTVFMAGEVADLCTSLKENKPCAVRAYAFLLGLSLSLLGIDRYCTGQINRRFLHDSVPTRGFQGLSVHDLAALFQAQYRDHCEGGFCRDRSALDTGRRGDADVGVVNASPTENLLRTVSA